ncbi:hypothetical protein H6792_00485 [Candidatus Nomurabacteria bacterium]|nr:hypothetical protein [Candidatus Nomurabacteria bacterium]
MQKKGLGSLMFVIILVLMVGIVFILGNFGKFFGGDQREHRVKGEVVDVADQFVELISSKQNQKAKEMLSSQASKAMPTQTLFDARVSAVPTDWEFINSTEVNNHASIVGDARFEDDKSGTITITLVKEDQQWRVENFAITVK